MLKCPCESPISGEGWIVFHIQGPLLSTYPQFFSEVPFRSSQRDCPGGQALKNLPPNTGDRGSIPSQGTKIPHATGQLSPCATTREARTVK